MFAGQVGAKVPGMLEVMMGGNFGLNAGGIVGALLGVTMGGAVNKWAALNGGKRPWKLV